MAAVGARFSARLVFTDGRELVIGGLSPNGVWTNPLLAGHQFGFDEQFKFESTGGGGWGSPKERPPERCLKTSSTGTYPSMPRAKSTASRSTLAQ